MKNWLSLALVAFFALSCSGLREARTGMDRAESCMDSAPDSALMIVRGIEGNTLPSRSLRARHALLLTMAQDKRYIDVKEDSTIRVAYEYYQRRGSRQEQLLSTYYLGVIQQNAENYIDAALAFRDAEPLAIDLGDNRQLSLIYQHLSRIFSLNYDHVRSLDYAEKALDAAEQAGEKLMADYCRYDVAEQLLSEYRYEEAKTYLSQILSSGRASSKLHALAEMMWVEAAFFGGESKQSLSEYRAIYEQLIRENKTPLQSHDYGMLASVCEKEGDSFSADHYLRIAESLVKSSVDSSVFYNDCRNVYDARKDWEKAHRAKTESVKIQDRMVIAVLGQSISHVIEEYYENKWEEEQRTSRLRQQMAGLVLLLLFGMAGVVIVIVRRRNRQVLEDMSKTQDLSSELVGTLISDKVNTLQSLADSYFSWDERTLSKREKREGKMMPDEIISSFRKQLNELRDDRSFVKALEQSLNLSESNIMRRVRDALPGAKELDYSILTLLFSGFSIKSISYLLNMSEPSLRMRKSRYKQQFDALPEPDRSTFLKKLG